MRAIEGAFPGFGNFAHHRVFDRRQFIVLGFVISRLSVLLRDVAKWWTAILFSIFAFVLSGKSSQAAIMLAYSVSLPSGGTVLADSMEARAQQV